MGKDLMMKLIDSVEKELKEDFRKHDEVCKDPNCNVSQLKEIGKSLVNSARVCAENGFNLTSKVILQILEKSLNGDQEALICVETILSGTIVSLKKFQKGDKKREEKPLVADLSLN